MPGIGDLARDARIKPAEAGEVFKALVDRVKRGEIVSIQGLGNFRMQTRRATKARNPQTGEQFDVPETKRLKFTASKSLKETLNNIPHKKAPRKEKPAAAAATPAKTA